jgi:hypothetical protein
MCGSATPLENWSVSMPEHLVEPMDSARRGLSEDQQKLIDVIWTAFALSPALDWPMGVDVRRKLGRTSALAALATLTPGAIVPTRPDDQYALTLYGAFLSSQGPRLFKMFVAFLEYVRTPDGHSSRRIRGPVVRDAIGLAPEDTPVLPKLINLSWLRCGSIRFGPEWECDLPENLDVIEELGSVAEYVESEARRLASEAARTQSYEARDPLDFVTDPVLKAQLSMDYAELSLVHNTRARKSTVILAGGILEGVLLDKLRGTPDEAEAAYRKLPGSRNISMDAWDLAHLVDVARELRLLPRGVVQISHGLREFRNLVHPGRQLRERTVLSEDEAELAVRVVEIALKALGGRA